MIHTDTVLPFVQTFARGGGGGSGGGGGGGGGGSAIALIGYLPTHFVTRQCMVRLNKQVAAVVGSIVGLAVGVPLIFLSVGFGLLVLLGAAVGLYTGLNDWYGKIKKRINRAKNAQRIAASADPVWDNDAVQAHVQKTFYDYQADWSNFKTEHMRTYLTPEYYQHAYLMMRALYDMRRGDLVQEPQLLSAQLVDVLDAPDNDDDVFSVLIHGKAKDKLVSLVDNAVIFEDDKPFDELWWFRRSGNDWRLQGIQQATEDMSMKSYPLESFAKSHDMYYSLDWGWLLLPQRGQLFGKAHFGKSDVNNHVIGLWNNHVVQLYTYVPVTNNAENYLIAQIVLPKSYGGILIRRTTSWWQRNLFVPKGYNRISMEWPDFNKHYTVFATDVDQVTSFELLNPKFMADLYDKDLPVNIEVVDNVVYLYSPTSSKQGSTLTGRYEQMLEVLQAAFKELRM